MATLRNVQNRCDLSNTELLDVAAALRVDGVKIESGLRNDLYDANIMTEFFEVQQLNMEVKRDKEIVVESKAVIICNTLLERVRM